MTIAQTARKQTDPPRRPVRRPDLAREAELAELERLMREKPFVGAWPS
jgi:hypothetical protein